MDVGGTQASDTPAMSGDDKQVMKIWNESITKVDGHYKLAVPFKTDPPDLPDNKLMAERRLQSLGRHVSKSTELRANYFQEMENLVNKDYAENVPAVELDSSPGKTWHLLHRGVVNPNKPEKLRVVFDCAD